MECMDHPPGILTPELLSVLVCPHDHGKLEYDAGQRTLTCIVCKRVYPLEKGVPNMLK